jgi:hypothetical protein
MTDETKQKLWALLLIVLTAVSGWLVNALNPTPAPVNPTPVTVTVESKPGVFGGGAPEVKVQQSEK